MFECNCISIVSVSNNQTALYWESHMICNSITSGREVEYLNYIHGRHNGARQVLWQCGALMDLYCFLRLTMSVLKYLCRNDTWTLFFFTMKSNPVESLQLSTLWEPPDIQACQKKLWPYRAWIPPMVTFSKYSDVAEMECGWSNQYCAVVRIKFYYFGLQYVLYYSSFVCFSVCVAYQAFGFTCAGIFTT